MDDERLKQAGGGDYWKELLARIRDIRSSEKVMYRQVLDLYATQAIQSVGEEVLDGAGKISHKHTMEKAKGEYRKYQVKTLSSVEKAYIETLRELKQIESNSKR